MKKLKESETFNRFVKNIFQETQNKISEGKKKTNDKLE